MRFKLAILWYFLGFRAQRWWYGRQPETLRRRRWKRLLRVLKASPKYAALADDRKAPLTEFPVVNKAIFMAEFDRINTKGIRLEEAKRLAFEAEQSRDFSPEINGITIGLSSGTSGNIGMFLVSEQERARWVAGVLDRVIGFSLKKRRVAFFLRANSNLYESARSSLLEFRFFDIFQPFDQHIETLGTFQPHIIVAQPSVLRQLALAMEAGTLKLTPVKVISVAEVLEPTDRALIEAAFGLRLDEVYQCTEGFLAATCPHGRLHMNEDFILLEKHYLDEDQKRFHPVITDLLRYTQPVVRYELNDILVEGEECHCGRAGTVIASIEGRSDDTWELADRTGKLVQIFPDMIRRAVITASPHISYYVLSQTGPHEAEAYLELSAPEASLEGIQQDVRKNLNKTFDKLNISPITLVFTEKVRFESGAKHRRIRNDYH